MKKYQWLFLLVAVCFIGLFSLSDKAQNNSDKSDKQVKISTNALELIEVTHSASECGKQKSTVVRLRVVSDSPVDVRAFVPLARVMTTRTFLNQKQGDEISAYVCNGESTFKFVSRPAGSSDEFPKP